MPGLMRFFVLPRLKERFIKLKNQLHWQLDRNLFLIFDMKIYTSLIFLTETKKIKLGLLLLSQLESCENTLTFI